jgi:tRNA dimethylallyltransferase
MRIISIVGPTAVGKTSFALEKARELLKTGKVEGVSLISADSRQVYKGLEVISGADMPPNFKMLGTDESIKRGLDQIGKVYKATDADILLFGVGEVTVNDNWSLAHFIKLTLKVVAWSKSRGFGVVVVGGTHLYQKQLVRSLSDKNVEQVFVKPNPEIRHKAESMKLVKLQSWLQELDNNKWQKMNESDRANPRRLVRSIEIALADPGVGKEKTEASNCNLEFETIKLLPPDKAKHKEKIKQRVIERLENGALDEVEKLLKRNLDPKGQVMTTLGVPETIQYLEGKIDKAELIDLWTLHETQYVKSQMKWLNE